MSAIALVESNIKEEPRMPSRERRNILAFSAAFLLLPLFSISSAQATPIKLPDVTMQVGPESSPMAITAQMLADNSESIVENANGSVTFANGSLSTANWIWTWTALTFKADPFISSVFGFQNNTLVTQTYVVSVSMPVAPLGPSTLMGGSMGGSVTDANFNGAGGVSTAAFMALYTGTIDGVPVTPAAELHPHPYSTPAFLFAGDTQNISNVTFGLPGPTVPGPAVALSIGINNRFNLSAGDIVAMTNFFIVEPVPEPSSIVLAALAGVALAWHVVRRKRSS